MTHLNAQFCQPISCVRLQRVEKAQESNEDKISLIGYSQCHVGHRNRSFTGYSYQSESFSVESFGCLENLTSVVASERQGFAGLELIQL
jgi:hypothetical protein